MEKLQGRVRGYQDVELCWHGWKPEVPKATVLLVHGFGEHVRRYKNVVNKLVPAGYGIFGLDLRGHGESCGQQGHVDRFCDYVEDLRRFYTQVVAPAAETKPLFVLGHSMGSIVTMDYVRRYPAELQGYVLSGTGSSFPNNSSVIEFVGSILSRLAPRKRIKLPLPPEFISRDPQVVADYCQDPLVFDQLSFRLASEMKQTLKKATGQIAALELPVLIQCGTADQSFVGQEQFFASLGAKDKTFRFYEGLKHEVYNELEPDRAQALEDLLTWLDAHLPQP